MAAKVFFKFHSTPLDIRRGAGEVTANGSVHGGNRILLPSHATPLQPTYPLLESEEGEAFLLTRHVGHFVARIYVSLETFADRVELEKQTECTAI